MTIDDVDWWIPHQANARIIHEAGRRIGIPPERTVTTIEQLGNSSAATIPVALAIHDRRSLLKQGQLILLTAVGAGMTSGAVLIRW